MPARRLSTDLAEVAARRLAGLSAPAGGWVPAPPDGAPPEGPPDEVAPDGPPAGRHARTAAAGAEPGSDAGRPQVRLAEALRGGVLAVSTRAAAALGVLAVLAVALGASYWLRGRPEVVPAPAPAAVTTTSRPPHPVHAAGEPTVADRGRAPVLVHVAGLVRKPGVVELPAGSRVADAVRAAGGPVKDADVDLLNLARPLADGEQVVVPPEGTARPPAPASGTGASPGAGSSGGGDGAGGGGGVVDLNNATLDQLQQLPGVGPVLAQRILDWRRQHGRFSQVDELREVSGIGERTYADLAPRVRV